MNERKGEKLGWTLGWGGGFFWVLILSIVFFFQNKIVQGLLGLLLVLIASAVICLFSPWKKPETQFWKLSLLPYSIFLVSIVWAVWAYGGLKESGLNWWNFLWLLPLFTPIFTNGKKRWIDGEPK